MKLKTVFNLFAIPAFLLSVVPITMLSSAVLGEQVPCEHSPTLSITLQEDCSVLHKIELCEHKAILLDKSEPYTYILKKKEVIQEAVAVPESPTVEPETEIVVEDNNVIDQKTEPAEGVTEPETEDNDIVEETVETKPADPEVTFREVDDYMYVYNAESLNMRTGPSTSYERITSIACGTEVNRIGIGSNGWAKIIYNGDVGYVADNYLTSEEPVVEDDCDDYTDYNDTSVVSGKLGDMGRLYIPEVGLSVALYSASIYDIGHSQSVTDRSDSAAYLYDASDIFGFDMIADHVHQGFNAIKWLDEGAEAYIDHGDSIEYFYCTDTFIGYNGYDGQTGMFDTYGNSVAGWNDGGLCMYTCNIDGTITITMWQPE